MSDRRIRRALQIAGLDIRDPDVALGELLPDVQPTLALLAGVDGNDVRPVAAGPTGALQLQQPNFNDMELVEDVTNTLTGASTSFPSTEPFDALMIVASVAYAGVLVFLDDAAAVEQTIVAPSFTVQNPAASRVFGTMYLFASGRRLGWRVLFGASTAGGVNVVKYRRRN